MPPATATRPGGRSARVQAAVHQAVRQLLEERDRGELTVPAVAERAAVTPSTIYRRWGDLQALLADVAVERIRPDEAPADTGTAKGDLTRWAEQYADEMASNPGREMIRDVLASRTSADNAGKCCAFVREHMAVLSQRAAGRGEFFPPTERIIDAVVAPIVYRILFDTPPDPAACRALVAALFRDTSQIRTEGKAGANA